MEISHDLTPNKYFFFLFFSLSAEIEQSKKKEWLRMLNPKCTMWPSTSKQWKSGNRSPYLQAQSSQVFSEWTRSPLKKMKALFRTAYYLAHNERPFTDFPGLLELQYLNGVKVGETYKNDKAAATFVRHIAEIYLGDLRDSINNSDFISIYSDGSTDRSTKEKEVIMVRVIENHYPVIKYLMIKEPENTKAEGILEAICKAFEEVGVENYQAKTVGYCSDGAAVMMGEKKGVLKLFKEAKEAPWVVSVWCMAHRLELAIKDTFKGTYFDTVVMDVLTSIYSFYNASAKRLKEAQEIAEIMEEHFSRPEKANGTRWVAHKLRAVTKLISNWLTVVVHLQHYGKDPANPGDLKAKAKGILKKMTRYKCLWYLHFMKDVLTEVSRVSLMFQRDDLHISSVVSKLQSVHDTLRCMVNNPGENLKQFLGKVEEGQYKEQKLLNVPAWAAAPIEAVESDDNPDVTYAMSPEAHTVVEKLLECLQSRFEDMHEKPLFQAGHVFDHKNWPEYTDREALLMYGHDEIDTLTEHLKVVLDNANLELDKVHSEWNDLKLHVARNTHFRATPPLKVWQRVSQEDSGRDDYQNILKVIHLSNTFPLSNASSERSFSTMKRVKGDWRASLSEHNIDRLMRISMSGPPLVQFDPKRAVKKWWSESNRSRRPYFQPHGSRDN